MSKFIVYSHESGETVFVRRDAVAAFKPTYVDKFKFRVFAYIGHEKVAVLDAPSMEEAKAWIEQQIKIIDGEGADEPRTSSSGKDRK